MPIYLPGPSYSSPFVLYGVGAYSLMPVPPAGGYGEAPYGLSSYGSVDIMPPTMTGANSLDGFRVELFFSEEMLWDSVLVDPTNYTFVATYGVPLTSVSVAPGTLGPFGGYTSVIVTHSGGTLGGDYLLTAVNITDLAGNPIAPAPANQAQFFSLGDTAQATVAVGGDGKTVTLSFLDSNGDPQDLLTEAQFSPGTGSLASYEVNTTYPVVPTLDAVLHPVMGDASQVALTLTGMTSTSYDAVVGPSLSLAYEGDTGLPDADPNFIGVEVGTGTSVPSAGVGLLLSKGVSGQYGWLFEDTSGRLVPNCAFRVDFPLNLVGTTFAPPLINGVLATLSVSDGAVQVDIGLADVAGSRILTVTSGAFSAQVPFLWEGTAFTVTLLRNQKGSFYSLIVDGVPFLTFPIASATGVPAYAPGAAVIVESGFAVNLFCLVGVGLTATSTVYTSAWNFLHGLTETFVGSGVLARDRVYTKYGPLVKAWGDTTPATKNDVVVRVNGVPVSVASVNPYEGEVYPTVPIPLTPVGMTTVEVDYKWFATPAFPLAGLNTRGLNLNAWSQAKGHTAGGLNPLPSTSNGVMPRRRFPLGVVLSPYRRKSPVRVGVKYYGWQRAYSALLNQYTTLRLNQNPRAISDGNLIAKGQATLVNYEGDTTPQTAPTPWLFMGQDTGGVVGDGTYRVTSSTSGGYGVGLGAVYYQEVDLSRTTSLQFAARLRVGAYTPDGVFTGVAFGAHNNRSLVLIGFVVVDGVRSLGLLRDPSRPDLESSWDLGLGRTTTAVSQTELEFSSLDFPRGAQVGDKLRVASGPQAGVYTIAECGLSEVGGVVTVTLTSPLPVSVDTYGADTFTVLFDMPWDEDEATYRVLASFPTGALNVYTGGRISGLALSLADLSVVGYTAQTGLLLPTLESGAMYWGSVSRVATDTATWNFVRYAATPAPVISTVTGIVNIADMTVPPDETTQPWFVVEDFGQGEVDSSGTRLLLKSNCADDTANLVFGYRRLEPYLSYKGVVTDFLAAFRVDSGLLGAGDASLQVRDGQREARVTTLQYVQYGGQRQLFSFGQVSLSGLRLPTSEGWTALMGSNLAVPTVKVHALSTVKTASTVGRWGAEITTPVTPAFVGSTGAILEARLQVASYTAGTPSLVAPVWSTIVPTAPGSGVEVQVQLTATGVALADRSGSVVTSYPFVWDDGAYHTYRLLIDLGTNTATLVVDDVVLGVVAGFTGAFPTTASSGYLFSDFGFAGTGAAQVLWDAVSCTPLAANPPVGAVLGKTLGVRTASGSETTIDGYRIPRSDNTSEPNSSLAAVPVVMNYTSVTEVRLRLDPAWGVSVYRPDLAPPPGFVSPEFVSETTDPNGAWINVEYRELPVYKVMFPEVPNLAFGALDKRSVTQQRWSEVKYYLRGTPNGNYLAPTGMVLNRSTALTSGEYTLDKTPEVRVIPARTLTEVYVWDAHMHAARVFHVQVDGVLLPTSAWSFDATSQVVTLTAPLPSVLYPVTVTFTVGKPVTSTYLCSQPVGETVTVLNDGTPIVPKNNYDLPETRVVTNDPLDPTEYSVTFTAGSQSRYVGLETCEARDGDAVPLSIACDDPAPGMGLAELALSGTLFSEWEHTRIAGGPGGTFGHGSPSVGGSTMHFHPGAMLTLGGGRPTSANTYNVLNTALLQTNQAAPGSLGMGLNQDFHIVLTVTTPYAETVVTVASDNTPPSLATPALSVNPNGVPNPNGHGACVGQLIDYAPTGTSRLGPWGGLASLSTNSLLAGGAQVTGTAFLLSGGNQLPAPTTTDLTILAAN